MLILTVKKIVSLRYVYDYMSKVKVGKWIRISMIEVGGRVQPTHVNSKINT